MNLETPAWWATASLDDLIDYAIGGDWGVAPDTEGNDLVAVSCIRGTEIRNWEKERGATAALRKVKKSKLESRALREGDILLEVSGGGPDQPVGRTVLIDRQCLSQNPNLPKIPTNFLRLLRPASTIEPRFLDGFLRFFYSSGDVVKYQGGSNNLRNLKFQDYISITIPLPPLAEQTRIVAKLEELFSELDAGEESLRTARRQLGVYRQSLLNQAFEGKLTAKWRKKNPDKLESPATLLARIQSARQSRYQQQVAEWNKRGGTGRRPPKPKERDDSIVQDAIDEHVLGPLPDGWSWCLFKSVCDFANGDRGKNYPNRSEYVSDGVPWINTGHIDPDGSLSRERMHFITRAKFETLNGGQIEPNDLVYCLRGATFGKTAFVRPYREGAIASSLMIVRPVQPESCRFIFRYLLSPLGKSQLKRFDNGSAQPNLSAENVGLYLFPLCPLPEQQEIVRLLDEQFEAIGRNEREIDAALRRSAALRQAILQKAFTGRLVPQDPTDEPASALLARIRDEGTSTSGKSRRSSSIGS